MSFKITPETIEQDITGYRERIRAAQDKLTQLPMTASHWRERKKLTSKRRYLEGEVAHVKKLIGMAEDALRVKQKQLVCLDKESAGVDVVAPVRANFCSGKGVEGVDMGAV